MRSLLAFTVTALSLGAPALSKLYQSITDLKQTHYDYVIVGGGTAGSVVAARLSEDEKNKVLVIEAGVDNANIQNIIVPFLGVQALNTLVDWNYTSTPQVGMKNRTIPLARGHVLGGSSSINYMTWNRGSNDVWDTFAKLSGDDGWSWNNVEKYNSEVSRLVAPADGHNTSGQIIPSAHGNGPVEVSLPGFAQELEPKVLQTSKELGGRFRYNEDFNAGDMIGIGYVQSSIGHGERSSSATAYLVPALGRDNLDVVVNSRAVKIRASKKAPDGGNTTIDTVEIAQSATGPRFNVTATKEVILSGGVFGSPQLLMLSGIGPKEELDKLGVPVVLDSPDVGRNLMEHPLLSVYYTVNSNNTFDDVIRDPSAASVLLEQWKNNRTGLMVLPAAGNTAAFMKNPDNFTVDGTPAGFDPSTGPRSGNTEIIFVNGFAALGPQTQPTEGHFMTVIGGVVSPTSRGTFTLNSTNPFDYPIIDPQLLTTNYDVQTMLQVMRDVDTFVAQPAWKDYVIKPLREFVDDADREDYIRANSVTINHCVGTARMGPGGVENGVVDGQLRVKGVNGLRIVDASIYPIIPENHPQAAAYILGERIADLIKSGKSY
ncbi:hypothetical protein E1B28_012796 [Marasmius oreades]|uniref:Aryl-alcohol oxidase n=1 Tax=Marasmius oreades TaxID=181124 RepID=A0A9P7RS86_9AGAR|nr:uncharacterized protein E1B28_012796 [Marasmius oreades]KAG7088841.1 hypothetical protein E1B28_012796 [Marasmius oreades]